MADPIYDGNLWAGSVWYNGIGPPASLQGINGDYYLQNDTNQIYNKINGVWVIQTDVTGYTGSRGDLGYTGSRGFTGSTGFTGSASTVQGPTGFTGSQGVGFTGSQGLRGYTGSQGITGFVGSRGATGFTGSQGFDGSQGYTGSRGLTVLSGTTTPTTQGIDGDFFINSSLWQIYGPKTARAWGSPTPITGVSANIMFIIDGLGATITTGIKGDMEIPFDCTITSVRLFADQQGSIVVDIYKSNFSNFPPGAINTITSASKPTISNNSKYEDSTLTGWTSTITAGDVLRFTVDSVSTITRLTVSLTVTRT